MAEPGTGDRRPVITVFADSPDGGRGLARDMRVRWALEEVGEPYDVTPLTFAELRQPAHLVLQPFGQIPTFQGDGVALFESGAIVLHLAERHPGLLPAEPAARARAIAWLFAALCTVEPPIVEREQAPYLERDQPWLAARLPLLDERIRARLRQLAGYLGERPWLDGGFSVGDLMMVMVLRRTEGMELLESFPNLVVYVERGKARPAYRRAWAAQRALRTRNATDPSMTRPARGAPRPARHHQEKTP